MLSYSLVGSLVGLISGCDLADRHPRDTGVELTGMYLQRVRQIMPRKQAGNLALKG